MLHVLPPPFHGLTRVTRVVLKQYIALPNLQGSTYPDGLGLADTLGAPSLGCYDVIMMSLFPPPLPLLIASDVTIMNGVVFHLRFFNVAHKQDTSFHVPGRHDAGLSSRAEQHARKFGG